MGDTIYALRLSGAQGSAGQAELSRSLLAALYNEGCCFDQFLYPYADSLLLSEREGYPVLFGDRALLWGVSPEMLKKCAKVVGARVEYKSIDADAQSLEAFLGSAQSLASSHAIGGFSQLLRGVITPATIREHSRRFCSFCEHISRLKGVEVLWLEGGFVRARLASPNTASGLKSLYSAKTGGIMQIL